MFGEQVTDPFFSLAVAPYAATLWVENHVIYTEMRQCAPILSCLI